MADSNRVPNRRVLRALTAFLALAILLAACAGTAPTPTSAPTDTAIPPVQSTDTLTPTQQPTATSEPTATIVQTPPALPYPYQSPYLNPLDSPHAYINDACEYLKLKWDPAKSAPGTVVMVVMFHSISKDANLPVSGIMANDFDNAMRTLKEQGFEAINMEQFVGFVESNEKIPERSVLLISDDRHQSQYFENFFYPLYQEWGWPVINAWISHPEQTIAGLWDQNEELARQGWVDYQAHGVVHYPIMESSTDEYILGELQGSIDFIQQHFNKTPIAFIWPGGNFTQRSVELARQTGFRVGFTVNPRGPIMFNWVPLADQDDPMRPSYLSEGSMNDPLMVLPRYWPSQMLTEVDSVRVMGKEAADYALSNKATELEYYEIVCESALGPIPNLMP